MANSMLSLLCGQMVLPLGMRDLFQCFYLMRDVLLVGHGVTVISVADNTAVPE